MVFSFYNPIISTTYFTGRLNMLTNTSKGFSLSAVSISKDLQLNPARVINSVIKRYGVSKEELMSKRRYANIVRARHILMYFWRVYCGYSYLDIARAFNMDRSTVLYAISKVHKNVSIPVYSEEQENLITMSTQVE